MSLDRVTKDGRCVFCGGKMILCEGCGKQFQPKRKNNVLCSQKCRTRKCRSIKNKLLD